MWDKIFSFCVPFPLAGLENCNPLCMTDLKFWIDCNFILWIPSSVNFRLSTELTSSQGSRLNIQTPDYVFEGINLDHSNSFSVIKITKQFKLSTLYLDSLNFHNGNKLNLFKVLIYLVDAKIHWLKFVRIFYDPFFAVVSVSFFWYKF